jgi:hypothetical protein
MAGGKESREVENMGITPRERGAAQPANGDFLYPLFLHTGVEMAASIGGHDVNPATLRPYSTAKERRPVALRPILSDGLPLSGISLFEVSGERAKP